MKSENTSDRSDAASDAGDSDVDDNFDRRSSVHLGEDLSAADAGPVADDTDGQDQGGVPWHHMQLYRLYGDEADYFLHPKLVIEKHNTGLKPHVHHALGTSKQGAANIGAKTLWTKLRDNSSRKLDAVDANIPQELKITYQSFVRDFVRSKENRDKYCMYTDKDVPDIEKLTDFRAERQTRDREQRTQVMWRQSQKNEDSAAILLYNNPLPDLNNSTCQETVRRYLPHASPSPEPANEIEDAQGSREQQERNQLMLEREAACSPRQLQPTSTDTVGPFKCVFLTEADAQGADTSSYRQRHAARPDTVTRNTRTVDNAKNMNKNRNASTSSSSVPQLPLLAVARSADERRSRQLRAPRRQRTSEPLTLAALLEYSPTINTAVYKHHQHLWPIRHELS